MPRYYVNGANCVTDPVTVGLVLLWIVALRSKGLVNSREHLESLVESMDSGFESIQDYLFRQDGLDEGLEQKAS